jgi:prophage regulatory protein
MTLDVQWKVLQHGDNLELPTVKAESGISRTKIYDDIKAGLFVHPAKLGPRAAGFPADEVRAINTARIAGKSDTEIRALVLRLEAARNAVAVWVSMEHITTALARAPLFAPPNDETSAVGAVRGLNVQPTSRSYDDDSGDCKAFASMRARFQLKGYSLQQLSCGGFLAHRWNYSRPLADLRQAAFFLRQIGGAAWPRNCFSIV